MIKKDYLMTNQFIVSYFLESNLYNSAFLELNGKFYANGWHITSLVVLQHFLYV